MNRFGLLFLLLVACGCMLSSCINDDEGEQGTIELKVGDRLPAFSVQLTDGRTMTTENLRGRPSLVVFFHTGCKDCQQEFPVLQSIYEDYGRKVEMVLISREEKAADIAPYWAEHRLTMPYSAQEDRTVYHLFAKMSIPRIYVSDKDLVIRRIFTDNPLASYEDIAGAIAECR